MRKPAIDRQGGAIALASGIASNPGTVYAVAALGGALSSFFGQPWQGVQDNDYWNHCCPAGGTQ